MAPFAVHLPNGPFFRRSPRMSPPTDSPACRSGPPERDARPGRDLLRALSRRLLEIAFALSALGLAGTGAVALYMVDRTQDSDQWVLHTAIAIGKLERLQLLVVEAESAGRGLLVTGAADLERHYRGARHAIDVQLLDVRAFTADNPVQQDA